MHVQASALGLIDATAESVYIGVDDTTISSGRGRKSVRITSKASFNVGGSSAATTSGLLFAFDLTHMPAGCGTWPAYWLCGPNWPSGGEIDVIEGVNTMTQDHTTLHTDQGCSMSGESTDLFTGSWSLNRAGGPSDDCWVDDPNQWSNAGCGIINTTPGVTTSYGVPFNAAGGGMYVMEWTQQFIRTYYFQRSQIPADLLDGGGGSPDPSQWSTPPYAYFTLNAESCPAKHFSDLQVIINIALCGDWGGSDFPISCPDIHTACPDYVQHNPSAFSEAFWSIRSLVIYQNQTTTEMTAAPVPAKDTATDFDAERWHPI